MPAASTFTNRPGRIVTVSIEFNDQHAFNVSFDANKITRHWVNHSSDDGEVYDVYVALCQVITHWDLTNDDGTPYPLTSESMADLKFSLDQDEEFVRQIVKASRPASAEGNASPEPSSTPQLVSTPQELTPPNGLVTSSSPAPSASPSPT